MKTYTNELAFRNKQIKITMWPQWAGLQIFSKNNFETVQKI